MSYWNDRKHLNYYKDVRKLLETIGPRKSILDIGPLDTPVATWGKFDHRYTVGPNVRDPLDGVKAFLGLWPGKFPNLELPVSVITCLQVIEHLESPRDFCDSLFASADIVIISVPYKWSKSSCSYHRHNLIDEQKLEAMTGRIPDSFLLATDGQLKRLITTYHLQKSP